MKDLIATLYPYCRKYARSYALGFACVLATNYLFVRSVVVMGETVDFLVGPDASLRGLWKYVGLMTGMVFVGAFAQYFQRMLLIVTSRRVEFEFRNDFFRHLTRLTPSFYDRMKTGDIIARATTDIDQVRTSLGPGIMYPLGTITSVPITLYYMLAASWTVSLVCFTPLLALPFFVRHMANLTYKRSLKVQEHFSEFSGRIQESITGISVVKSFVQGEHEQEVLDGMSRENAKLNLSLATLQAMFFPVLMVLFGTGNLIVIWMGSKYVPADPALLADPRYLTKGELVAFSMLYANLFFPVLGLGWVMSIYQRASASMHRLQLILREQPEIENNAETDYSIKEVKGEIEFRNLTFTYPHGDSPSLRNVSLRIPRGNTLGIVGAVGSGKSTFAQLITRLYQAPKGQLFVDGRDIREFPLDVLREGIGVVFQEPYLFSDTIMENICFGMSDGGNEEAAREAARIADVEKDILEFPKQFDTMLGERGINLSGGQKQRVSLARAVACNPPILILDDAFSAVDTHTEERILEGITKVLEDRTTILISHRISTVRMADEIIVVDDGAVVERGTHAELVALGGQYADINSRQKLEEAVQEED